MPLAKLRKVGGSVMVAIPPGILEEAKISEGSEVEVTVDRDSGSIGLRSTKPRYTLAELLAEIDPDAKDTEEDLAWINGRAVGSEII